MDKIARHLAQGTAHAPKIKKMITRRFLVFLVCLRILNKKRSRSVHLINRDRSGT